MSRGSIMLGAGVLLGLLGLLWPSEVHARETTLAGLDLDYAAPAECPSREQIDAMLRARLPDGAGSSTDTRHFEARVVRDDAGGYVGRLDVRGPGLANHVREIHAPTCRAVSTSLVLFLVLALAPSSQGEHEAEAEKSSLSPVTAPPPSSPPRGKDDETHPASPAATWTLSSGFQATWQHVPEAAWGGRVHAELARSPALHPLGTSVRLSYGWSDFSTFPLRAGEAKFRQRTGRLECCARFRYESFVLSPCAALNSGASPAVRPRFAARPCRRSGLPREPGCAPDGSNRDGSRSRSRRACRCRSSAGASRIVDPVRTVYEPPAVVFDVGAGFSVSAQFR